MRPLVPAVLLLALASTACTGEGTETKMLRDPTADVDDDGLTNAEEDRLGTDPTTADSDGDGLTDGREVLETRTDPLVADTDQDGLSDGEEVDTHSTNPLDVDTDDDGLEDGDEVDRTTDPLDPDSDDDGLTDGAEIGLATDPLDDDTDNDTLLDGDEALIHGTDPTLPDTDADGLSDADEVNVYETNPLSSDTDADGLLDGDEITGGTNPKNPDSDGDYVSDGDEITNGTDPLDADTDDDGLEDGVEPYYGSDPTVADTDKDGLEDGPEVLEHLSDPTLSDTDGDGLGDFDEVMVHGTHPAETDTDADGLPDPDEVSGPTDPLDDDTDDDGLLDGDEVNTHGTDPVLADTDGDTLLDGHEVKIGTNPLLRDTDSDGLDDNRELDFGTNPLLADSDADGLDDLEEIATWGTDPLDDDTDDDGLIDGDEITEGADPFDPDTDADHLEDGEEVNIEGTDPLDRDTDGGGSTDGAEVLADATDPLDPSDDACNFVSEGVEDPTFVPSGPDFDPFWIGVEFRLLTDANGVNDFFVDVDDDGTADLDERDSSALVIKLYGPEIDYLCSVVYEADFTATTELFADHGWDTDGGSVLEAYKIAASGGSTDCPSLDATVYGDSDIRNVLDDLDWGVGIGELGDIETGLRNSVQNGGGDWTTDWAPYVYGTWISWDGSTAQPLGYAFDYAATCDEVTLDTDGFLVAQSAVSTGAVDSGLRLASDFVVTEFVDVTGIQCDRADIDAGSTTWTPASFSMNGADVVAVAVDVVQVPDGSFADFYFDSDDDGIAEAYSATIEFEVLDSSFTSLCTVVFEADGAELIDESNLNAFDASGKTSGPVNRAWTLTLDTASSDCGEIDATVFGTTNIVTHLSTNWDFVYGIGQINAMDTTGTAVWGASWTDIKPLTHSEYLGFNGVDVYESNIGALFDTDDCLVVDDAGVFFAPAGENGVVGNLSTLVRAVVLPL